MDIFHEQISRSFQNYGHLFPVNSPIWEIISSLNDTIKRLIGTNDTIIDETAYVHEQAIVYDSYIGRNVKIYEGCTVRDSIVLENTTIGHATEVARSLILGHCFLSRFDYVGSSFLGERVHLGGGVMLATRRHDNKSVVIQWQKKRIKTNQERFGSIVGDNVTIAYGSHVNPGVVIGKNSLIMPMTDVRGYVPSDSMMFVEQKVARTRRRTFPDTDKLRI